MACKKITRDSFRWCLKDEVKLEFIERTSYTPVGKDTRTIQTVLKTTAGVPQTVSRLSGSGLSQINGVATNSGVDIKFYIRYQSLIGLDQSRAKYVKYNNFIYKIESYENKDLKNDSWIVYARSRGFDDKEASKV